MDALYFLQQNRIRVVPDRRNWFEIDDVEFYHRFRISKNMVHMLVLLVGDRLIHVTDRNKPLEVADQLLIVLRLMLSGSYQSVIGDTHFINQSTVSRVMHSVVHVLCAIKVDFIKFPNDLERTKQEFFDISMFPGVIGLIDGTHVPLLTVKNR